MLYVVQPYMAGWLVRAIERQRARLNVYYEVSMLANAYFKFNFNLNLKLN